MKIRTILVAAAVTVILAGFSAKVRIDRWENSTDACFAQLERNRVAFARADAADERNIQDVHIIGWQDARSRETQTYQVLLRLLENKPFGIPLDQEEQSVLDSVRVELARRDP
jgi:hypothetical protein